MTQQQDQWNDAIQELQRRGWTVTPPPPDPPENRCSWCGMSDSENEDEGFGPCTDITVAISQGEEGHVVIERHACNDHLISVPDKLMELGFTSHRHGGINFLEDRSCPGAKDMGACPVLTRDEMYDADR